MKLIGIVLFVFVFIFPMTVKAIETDVKDWTIYIHLNADNNLCPYASKDLAEIKTLDVSKYANIIVAYDCDKQGDSKLIKIEGNKEIVLESGLEYDMGDYRLFTEKANYVFENFPSKYKMIDVWNHGAGWKKRTNEVVRGISYDDQSGHNISTVQLGVALKEISTKTHVDLIGYDACLMQMIEIAYEVAPYVDYSLGSEETEPGDGWDYRGLVKAINDGVGPVDLGIAITNSYNSYYNNSGITMSLVESKAIEELSYAMKNLGMLIAKEPKINEIISKTPGYAYSDYKDLGIFLNLLKPYGYITNEIDLYNKAIVYTKNGKSATGLSIYINKYPSVKYKELKFDKDTQWFDNFLKKLKPPSSIEEF